MLKSLNKADVYRSEPWCSFHVHCLCLQEGAASQKAVDEESPLGQAFLKYMDALACDEAKALFNFHVGRMQVVQGKYEDAVKRLETSLNWNANHPLSR